MAGRFLVPEMRSYRQALPLRYAVVGCIALPRLQEKYFSDCRNGYAVEFTCLSRLGSGALT